MQRGGRGRGRPPGQTIVPRQFTLEPIQSNPQLPAVTNIGMNFPAKDKKVTNQHGVRPLQGSPVRGVRSMTSSIPKVGGKVKSDDLAPRRLTPLSKGQISTASRDSPSKPGTQTPDMSKPQTLGNAVSYGDLGSDNSRSSLKNKAVNPSANGKDALKNPGRKVVTPNKSNTKVSDSSKSENKTEKDLKNNTKPVLPKISAYERVLCGYLDNIPPRRSSVVRLFLSSTFSDFKSERNALQKNCYPVLKQHCAQLGLDFEVVDLRWGISEDATNDHQVEALCLQEIEHCQRLSKGTNFVAMLGDRYGYRPVPPDMDAAEFEVLRQIGRELSVAGLDVLDTWYRRDDNAEPPRYILQPVDSILTHFTDADPENADKKREDSVKWNDASRHLAATLRECAAEAVKREQMTQEREHQLCYSVTEQEVTAGLLKADNAQEVALVFVRHLSEIEEGVKNSDQDIKRFIEVTQEGSGGFVIDDEVMRLRRTLQEDSIVRSLPESNRSQHSVLWKAGGVNPDHAEHQTYLDDFCEVFSRKVREQTDALWEKNRKEMTKECAGANEVFGRLSLVTKSKAKGQGKVKGQAAFGFGDGTVGHDDFFRGKFALDQLVVGLDNIQNDSSETEGIDPFRIALNTEILHHLHLCRSKCDVFCGRSSDLATVKDIMKKHDINQPVVISGESGSGKTAFVSMVAKQAHDWLGGKGVVVIRYLGTSPQSSAVRLLLASICSQICAAYKFLLNRRRLHTLRQVLKYFPELLHQVSVIQGRQKPLVIILDGLGQVSSIGKKLESMWFPHELPTGIHIIATVRSESAEILDKLKSLAKNKACFLELPNLLPKQVVLDFIKEFSSTRKRKFTEQQMTFLVNHVTSNAQPLLMKLNLDEACKWHSYQDIDWLSLSESIPIAINRLFGKFEKKFGKLLIAATFGYITASLGGVSNVELEDVLSCSDHVLNEVYKYHNPPLDGIVRIPPLIWARIRYDLGEYLAERAAHGKTMLYWCYIHFADVARERYLTGEDPAKTHSQLAEIFAAEEPIKRTITLEQRKLTLERVDRQIDLQPMAPSSKRKLAALQHHLHSSGQGDKVLALCYCNIKFLECYIQAFSLYDLLGLMAESLAVMGLPEIKLVHDCLKYSASMMQNDLDILPAQILGSLLGYAGTYPQIRELCDGAKQAITSKEGPRLLPVLGSVPLSFRSLQWHVDGPESIVSVSEDACHMLLRMTGDQINHQLLNTDTLELGGKLQRMKMKDEASDYSSHNGMVYMQHKECVLIYDGELGQVNSRIPTSLNRGSSLNQKMALSSDAQYLVVAGTDRLAMFEMSTKSGGEIDYASKSAMNLTGATSTSNLIFSHDGKMTISSHKIKGKDRVIGAVVSWSFLEQQLKVRVPLPAGVLRGFLFHSQPMSNEDVVVCGCENGQIFIVDVSAGKVLTEIAFQNGPMKSASGKTPILSSFDHHSKILVTAVKSERVIHVINADKTVAKEVMSLTTEADTSALGVVSGGQKSVVGDVGGDISIFSLGDGSLLERFPAHGSEVISVCCESLDQLYTCGKDSVLKCWDRDDRATADAGVTEEVLVHDGKRPRLELETVRSCCMMKNGQTLFTVSDTRLSLWKQSSSEFQFSSSPVEGDLIKVVGSSSESRLVMLQNCDGGKKKVIFCECSADQEESTVPVDFGEADEVSDVFVLGDCAHVLCSHETQSSIKVIDLEKQEVKKNINISADVQGMDIVDIVGRFLVCNAPGDQKAKALLAFDMDSGDKVACCRDNDNEPVLALCAAKSGPDTFLIGCKEELLSWQPHTRQCRAMNTKNRKLAKKQRNYGNGDVDEPYTSLTVTEDWKMVVAGSENGALLVWRLENGGIGADTMGTVLTGHRAAVTSAAINREKTALVSGSVDRSVVLWNLATWSRLSTIHVHLRVCQLEFFGDDGVLVLGADSELRRILLFQLTK